MNAEIPIADARDRAPAIRAVLRLKSRDARCDPA
jgi:hypothetical protein